MWRQICVSTHIVVLLVQTVWSVAVGVPVADAKTGQTVDASSIEFLPVPAIA